MAYKKIKFLHDVKLEAPYGNCYKDEVRSFPDAVSDRCISLGWAECNHSGECGDFIPGSRLLNEDGTLGAATKTIQPDDTVTTTAAVQE